MPKASRNERKKRRVKRTNSLLKRQLRGLSQEAHKSYVFLMAILAQKGGEVVVAKGTLVQSQQNILTLGYQVVDDLTDTTSVIVRLVTVGEPKAETTTDEEIEHAVFVNDPPEPATVADIAPEPVGG